MAYIRSEDCLECKWKADCVNFCTMKNGDCLECKWRADCVNFCTMKDGDCIQHETKQTNIQTD